MYLFIYFITNNKPKTVKKAMGIDDMNSWKEAMNEEMSSLKKNNTLDIVHLSFGNTYWIKMGL